MECLRHLRLYLTSQDCLDGHQWVKIRKQLVEYFARADKYIVSDDKVIFWSKTRILHGDLSEIRNVPDGNVFLYLVESAF